MTVDGSPPDPPSLAEEWRTEQAKESTRSRIYTVALQLYEPTRVRPVAERADVSKETARDYLKWFVDLGVLTQVDHSPDTFERNEQYFEWRRIQRLRSQTDEELLEQLEDLTRAERTYREQFEADDPSEVDALEHGGYDDLETVWRELREWETVRRRIRELERARQGHGDGTQVLA